MAGQLISREALDRIIQRAAELQTGDRDIGEGLTEDELLALGKDVGIPGRYLKQALLEERTRLTDAAATGGGFFGPGQIAAHRVVPGERGAVERALSLWMEDQELLRVKRRYPDRTTWERQVGFMASVQRGLKAGGKTYDLTRANEVSGQVTPLESGFCHVQLVADVRNLRNAHIGGAAGLLAAGATGTGVAVALGVLLPVAVLPAAVLSIALLGVRASNRAQSERIQVGLEQVLDRLERGEIKAEHALPGPRASAFHRIADEIRKQFQA